MAHSCTAHLCASSSLRLELHLRGGSVATALPPRCRRAPPGHSAKGGWGLCRSHAPLSPVLRRLQPKGAPLCLWGALLGQVCCLSWLPGGVLVAMGAAATAPPLAKLAMMRMTKRNYVTEFLIFGQSTKFVWRNPPHLMNPPASRGLYGLCVCEHHSAACQESTRRIKLTQ